MIVDEQLLTQSGKSGGGGSAQTTNNRLVFDVEHLATFAIEPKLGALKAQDGMRKLRLMEKANGGVLATVA